MLTLSTLQGYVLAYIYKTSLCSLQVSIQLIVLNKSPSSRHINAPPTPSIVAHPPIHSGERSNFITHLATVNEKAHDVVNEITVAEEDTSTPGCIDTLGGTSHNGLKKKLGKYKLTSWMVRKDKTSDSCKLNLSALWYDT